jgi:hypothetical protein
MSRAVSEGLSKDSIVQMGHKRSSDTWFLPIKGTHAKCVTRVPAGEGGSRRGVENTPAED